MSDVFHPSGLTLPGRSEQADVHADQIRLLRRRVASIEGNMGKHAPEKRLSLGPAEIDDALCGGLEAGALHEIFPADGRAHAATLWFAAMLAAQLPGPILWCSGHRGLFPPGLAAAGLGPERVLHVCTPGMPALLSSMEEGLGAVATIVGEPGRDLPMASTRRLQLGAVRAATLALLVYRPAPREGFAPTAAASRWQLGVMPSATSRARALSGSAGLGARRLRLDLLRLRGNGRSGLAGPQSWMVEIDNGTAGFAVVADLADRSAAPQWQPRLRSTWRISG